MRRASRVERRAAAVGSLIRFAYGNGAVPGKFLPHIPTEKAGRISTPCGFESRSVSGNCFADRPQGDNFYFESQLSLLQNSPKWGNFALLNGQHQFSS
jgi:hypothetical protein